VTVASKRHASPVSLHLSIPAEEAFCDLALALGQRAAEYLGFGQQEADRAHAQLADAVATAMAKRPPGASLEIDLESHAGRLEVRVRVKT
jgi:hypothetical protein